MKKWYKECPFCANKIKEWAIKCKYCDETLIKENSNLELWEEAKKIEVIQYKKKCMAEWLYKWSIWMIILIWLSFFWGYTNKIFWASRLWIFWIMMWCRYSYKIILTLDDTNLHFKSSWWPTRWRICPVASFFIPYLAVLDIYTVYNKKSAIIPWWWWCFLGSHVINVIINYPYFNRWEIWILLYSMMAWLYISALILTMKIIKKTN